MKLSKITLVFVVALALVALAVPASAWWGPLGCGFGVPFGVGGCGSNFVSSFQSSTSFSTFGTAGVAAVPFGIGCGVPFGVGFGGCGLGFGGLGFC